MPKTGDRFCADGVLDARIRRLHDLALEGVPGIQPHIDAFLPAVALAEEGHPLARRAVLGLPDAPQVGTLPDLGASIRLVLLGQASAPCGRESLEFLQRAMPRTSKDKGGGESQPQVAICVLLGLLLGLYPKSVRFPPFPVRVALYRRVHRLLTDGSGQGFCAAHPRLLTLAFMEYCAHVIPACMPVEEELLSTEPAMRGFFAGCSLACDAFRQEALVTGEEGWAELERHCAPVVERHLRTCKSKRPRQEALGGLRPADPVALMRLPYIVPYDVHLGDPTHCIMGGEMAFLGLESVRHDHAAVLQRTLRIHPLPGNLRGLQLQRLAANMAACERSALSKATLYVCVACVMSGQAGVASSGLASSWDAHGKRRERSQTRGLCKLDVDLGGLVCASCQGETVVGLATLGRVLTIRQNRFYLAPCCGTVQLYTGRGDEFTGECRHSLARPPRQGRPRCEICGNVALPEALEAVDHLEGRIRGVHLCQRHTPHEDALRHVSNWRQLEAEIRKRDRPLFRNER